MSFLRSIFGFAKHELRQGWRSGEFYSLLVLASVATAIPCAEAGTTASLAGYVAGQTAVTVLGFLGMIWFSLAACRDVLTRTEPLILSKSSSGESIVFGRFLGNFGVVLLLLVGELAAGAFSQSLIAKTPFAFMSYVHAFERSVVPLFFLGSMSYSFSLLFGTPVTGLLAITYWISVLTSSSYLRSVFNCSLTQNSWIYISGGAALLALTALLYHPRRRGAQWLSPPWAIAASALFLATALFGVRRARTSHDVYFYSMPLMEAMQSQHLTPGQRPPGFWLPDQFGQTVRLEQFDGKIVVIGLWSPGQMESAELLNILSEVSREFPREQVVPIAVGISDDHAVPRHVALDSGYTFPVVTDVGGRVTTPFDLGSPMAGAYNAQTLPLAVVADRRRRSVFIRSNVAAGNLEEILRTVRSLVKEQFPGGGTE
jgi:peroxiredoxin